MTATRGHEAGARDRAWAIVHDPYDMDRPGVPLVTVPRDALVDRIAAALQAAVQAERERLIRAIAKECRHIRSSDPLWRILGDPPQAAP